MCEDQLIALLQRFNNKENKAFGEVYDLVVHELLFFARRVYHGTDICPHDVIHDIFLKLWESKQIQFEGISNVKAYVMVALKNHYKDYMIHSKYVDEYNQKLLLDDDCFVSHVSENELFSLLSGALAYLPEECAKVFRLHVDGWDVKDIAEKLGKTPSTVYKQKQEAIRVLKDKLPKDIFVFLTPFF